MKQFRSSSIAAIAACGLFLSTFASAEHDGDAAHKDGEVCQGYGPQTPRDIDSLIGTNKVQFSLAGDSADMNLCNIHFHNNAEHKAKDFSILAGEGDARGYQCKMSKELSKAELKPTSGEVCNGLKPGDTIEVHWVHTSCDIEPGKGLGSCLSPACANPDLRVETQVFTLVNDADAPSFANYAYAGNKNKKGYHQAKALPKKTGKPVQFLGSTTGPKYSEQSCSALQVSWSVRPKCAKLDINTLGKWCEGNVFEEDHAHGVRKLVVNPDLLSKIK